MPIDRTAQKLKARKQMLLALELKLAGATYEQIGKSFDPPVSRQRAFKVVQKGLNERIQECQEVAERARMVEVARIDRWMFALEPKKHDPRAVDTLLRLSESRRRLLGLDAPSKTELSGTIQTEQTSGPDLSKLSDAELDQLEQLHEKMRG